MLQSYYHKGKIEAGCDEAGRGCLAGSVYAANVFRAQQDMDINAVSTYFLVPDTGYEVSVYTEIPADGRDLVRLFGRFGDALF